MIVSLGMEVFPHAECEETLGWYQQVVVFNWFSTIAIYAWKCHVILDFTRDVDYFKIARF